LSGRAGVRAVLAAVLSWGVPFALGPPLFSRDAYAYAAQGELARRGLDPATHGVSALTADATGAAFSNAVDPRWRDTHTPYGGGAVAVEKLAATIGHALGTGPAGALVTMRIIAVLSVVAMVVCTARLVDRLLPATATMTARHADGPAEDRHAPTDSPGIDTATATTTTTATTTATATATATTGTKISQTQRATGDANRLTDHGYDGATAESGDVWSGGAARGGGRPGEAGWRAHGRGVALILVAANPVTLIHLVGGMHLDALAAATLVGALLIDRRRSDRLGAPRAGRLSYRAVSGAAVLATALACFAGTLKVTALIGFGWLLVAHARDAARPGLTPDSRTAAPRWGLAAAAVAADLVVAAAMLGLSMLASGFPPTWIKALATSGELTTGIAPASILASLAGGVAGLVGWHTPAGRGSTLLAGCRGLTLAAAAVVVAVLLWRAWRRAVMSAGAAGAPPDGGDGLAVLGIGGLAVALGSPVLYPWYLGPVLPMLGILAAAWHLAHQRPAPEASGSLPANANAGAGADARSAVDVHAADDDDSDSDSRGNGSRELNRSPDEINAARRRCRAVVMIVCVTSIWLCGATLAPLAQTWRLLGRHGPAFPAPLVVTTTVAAALLVTAAVATARALARLRAASG